MMIGVNIPSSIMKVVLSNMEKYDNTTSIFLDSYDDTSAWAPDWEDIGYIAECDYYYRFIWAIHAIKKACDLYFDEKIQK